MEIKGSEFLAAQEGLGKLASKALPIKAVYALTKVLRQAEGAGADLEKARLALLKRYAVKDAAGEMTLTDDQQATLTDPEGFHKEYLSLLEEPVTLEGCRALTLDEVADGELSAVDVMRLGPFVVEG